MAFPTFKKKEDIPKGFEGEYEEKGGEWVAKAADTSKADETIAKIRKEKNDAEKAQKDAEKERDELTRKLAVADTGGEKDKVAKALQKFDEDAKKMKDEYDKKIADKDGELRKLKLDDQAKAAFLKAGGRPEKADAALKLKKDLLDLTDDRIVVKNAKGEPTTTTVEDFWGKDFKTEMPEFFTGTKATGGGAKGGAGAQPGKGQEGDAELVLKNPRALVDRANEELAAAGKSAAA